MEKKFDGMPLTVVLRDWMEGEKWKAEININEARTHSEIESSVTIHDHDYKFIFEIDEPGFAFGVFIHSPCKVAPARMADMTRLLNRINYRLRVGVLGCLDDEDANSAQVKGIIDVEGERLCDQMILNLYGSGRLPGLW